MRQGPDEPSAPRGQAAKAGPAVEDHGRVVTASAEAAAFYRQAQKALTTSEVAEALRSAVRADPAFCLALADLDAITRSAASPGAGHQMNWERHHIEIVRTAAAGNFGRAADLLREHLASVGCDPLAVRLVAELRGRTGYRGGLDDLAGQLPECHPSWRLSRGGLPPGP